MYNDEGFIPLADLCPVVKYCCSGETKDFSFYRFESIKYLRFLQLDTYEKHFDFEKPHICCHIYSNYYLILQIVQDIREVYYSGRTLDVQFRKEQLKSLRKLYDDHADDFCAALAQDLHKVKADTSPCYEQNL